MDPKVWQEVSDLFEQALDQPEGVRSEWLNAAATDPVVLREVQRMLSAHDLESGLLEKPVEDAAAELVTEAGREHVPERVGPFTLEDPIGSGGMGSVFRAHRTDGQFDQVVAVKLLKGHLSASHFEERFLAERRILATLDHPNIARLLDGGITDSGLPYFVMELIDGEPITDYASARSLALSDRLELFLGACDAVSHAHRMLVVHRDLKPSNIMVTRTGEIKLLDFGIAKLLESEDADAAALASPITVTGVNLMTPDYASPEQVKGEPITTSSDVYQLGLMLFELVTGQRAQHVRSGSVTEIARVVCEKPAPKPSSVTEDTSLSALDVDAVVLKALRKAPADRYQSVAELAEDVRRLLGGYPVTARAGSRSYAVRKFIGRNRLRVLAGAAVLILLLGATLALTIQNTRVVQERDRAQTYIDFMSDMLASPDPFNSALGDTERDITVREYLNVAADRIRTELAGDPAMQAELLRTVGKAYSGLGAGEEARMAFGDAVRYARAAHGGLSVEVIELLRLLANEADDFVQADSLYRRQLAMSDSLGTAGRRMRQQVLVSYGSALITRGRLVVGDSVLSEAMRMESEMGVPLLDSEQDAAFFRGRANLLLGHYELADSMLAYSYQRRVDRDGPSGLLPAMILTEIAKNASSRGDIPTAVETNQQILATFEPRLGSDHPYTIRVMSNLAVAYSKQEETLAQAEEIARQIIERTTSRFGPDARDTIDAIQNHATILLAQEQFDLAEVGFLRSRQGYDRVLPDEHHRRAFPLLSLSELYINTGRFSEAESITAEASDQLLKTLPPSHPIVLIADGRNAVARFARTADPSALNDLDRTIEQLQRQDGFGGHVGTLVTWRQEFAGES